MKITFSINDLKIPTVSSILDPARTVGNAQFSIDADMSGLLAMYSPANIAASIENNISIVHFLAENNDTVQAAIGTVLEAVNRIASFQPERVINDAFDRGYKHGRNDFKAARTQSEEEPERCCTSGTCEKCSNNLRDLLGMTNTNGKA